MFVLEMAYFNKKNTQGFTDEQLAEANRLDPEAESKVLDDIFSKGQEAVDTFDVDTAAKNWLDWLVSRAEEEPVKFVTEGAKVPHWSANLPNGYEHELAPTVCARVNTLIADKGWDNFECTVGGTGLVLRRKSEVGE